MKKVLSLIISISMLLMCIPCVAQASEWISEDMTIAGGTATAAINAKISTDALISYTFYDANGALIGTASENRKVTDGNSLSANCPDGTAKAKAVINPK